jgi:hypothetical protein
VVSGAIAPEASKIQTTTVRNPMGSTNQGVIAPNQTVPGVNAPSQSLVKTSRSGRVIKPVNKMNL